MAKKLKPTPGPAPEAELTQAVDRLTEMLSVVEDTLSQIKGEIAWILNNREELKLPVPVITRMPKKASDPEWGAKLAALNKPESIACTDCDADSPDSLAVALHEGWTELTPDNGVGWNYLGLCPDCLKKDYERPSKSAATQQPDDESEGDQQEPGNPEKTLF